MGLCLVFCLIAIATCASDSYKQYVGLFKNTDGTPAQLRRQFRRLAVEYHPDKVKGDKAVAARKFTLIQEAFQKLLRKAEGKPIDDDESEDDDEFDHNWQERQRVKEELRKARARQQRAKERAYEREERWARERAQYFADKDRDGQDDDDEEEEEEEEFEEPAEEMPEKEEDEDAAERRREAEQLRRWREALLREHELTSSSFEKAFSVAAGVLTVVGMLLGYWMLALKPVLEEIEVEAPPPETDGDDAAAAMEGEKEKMRKRVFVKSRRRVVVLPQVETKEELKLEIPSQEVQWLRDVPLQDKGVEEDGNDVENFPLQQQNPVVEEEEEEDDEPMMMEIDSDVLPPESGEEMEEEQMEEEEMAPKKSRKWSKKTKQRVSKRGREAIEVVDDVEEVEGNEVDVPKPRQGSLKRRKPVREEQQ